MSLAKNSKKHEAEIIKEYIPDLLKSNLSKIAQNYETYESAIKEQLLAVAKNAGRRQSNRLVSTILNLGTISLAGWPIGEDVNLIIEIKKHYLKKLDEDDIIKSLSVKVDDDFIIVDIRLFPQKIIDFSKHPNPWKHPKITIRRGSCLFGSKHVGNADSRQSRLLKYMDESSGAYKAIQAVFQEIKIPNEKIAIWKLDDPLEAIPEKKKIITQTVKDIQVKAKNENWPFTIQVSFPDPRANNLKDVVILDFKKS